MSLREQAETDLSAILSDGVTGFGWPITVTDPAGLSAPLTGFSNDIAQVIDPSTGQVVSGREVSVALSISALTAAGFTIPQGIVDSASKPWVVAFTDINGTPGTFKIRSSDPDRALGVVVCMLELYVP